MVVEHALAPHLSYAHTPVKPHADHCATRNVDLQVLVVASSGGHAPLPDTTGQHARGPSAGRPPQSYQRYELYKSATTVQEFKERGGTSADLKHDIEKGFITLNGQDGAALPPSPVGRKKRRARWGNVQGSVAPHNVNISAGLA